MNLMNFVISITNMETTTISISKQTREMLASLGTKDSTFDSIIQKLIENWREQN